MNIPILSSCLFITSVSLVSASLVIENFDSYESTGALQSNWNSFGTAATAGAPVLHIGEGVGGSNAARFALDWRGVNNTNANARRINLNNLDLSGYSALSVVAFIETRATFEAPPNPTVFKVAIQGANNAIWQTPNLFAPTIENDTYQNYVFQFSDLQLVDGGGALMDVLLDVSNIRLRFENAPNIESRQDVYFDSVAAIPEPGTWGVILGSVGLVMVYLRRRAKS